ncbi:MAG: corrinoid protein [Deltaproteobacteria bacterium]|nr:corrinoid protein [Deltaproteobacteria bacterium]MBW2285669.1 corrinoid protein [Deltaproteobacteria bacterium]
MNQHIEGIKAAVVDGKHKDIEALVKNAVDDGMDLNDLINNALIAAMDVIGEKFSKSEIFVPEMLVAAVTMKKGLEIIQPLLTEDQTQSRGSILMGTVKGDLHDIGKNLVIMILRGSGFDVVDLGVDLSVESVVEKVEELKPDILGLSALLTTTMPEMKRVIEALEAQGLRSKVKVVVGGAPIDAKFAEEIGSDGYGKDAAEAVQLARKLVAA